VCDFILAFSSGPNYVPDLHRFRDIVRYWSKIADFDLPICIWRFR